jgi:molybdopterin-guanine dinucleotide biosynthesis protein A
MRALEVPVDQSNRIVHFSSVTISCRKVDATLCILAGGESRRMGRPKAELRVRGQPILTYLLHRFDWRGATMLVTAPSRRTPGGAEIFDREVVDPVDGAGPLRGVLTALEHLQTPLAVITTADMPCIGAEHLRWLIDHYDSEESNGLMLCHGGQIQPFPSIYRAAAIAAVKDGSEPRIQLEMALLKATQPQADLSLQALMFRIDQLEAALATRGHVSLIDAPPAWRDSVWTNLNTPDDLDTFTRQLDVT